MCMSQVCSNAAVWKHAKYGINTSADTYNCSKLCLKLLTADQTCYIHPHTNIFVAEDKWKLAVSIAAPRHHPEHGEAVLEEAVLLVHTLQYLHWALGSAVSYVDQVHPKGVALLVKCAAGCNLGSMRSPGIVSSTVCQPDFLWNNPAAM